MNYVGIIGKCTSCGEVRPRDHIGMCKECHQLSEEQWLRATRLKIRFQWPFRWPVVFERVLKEPSTTQCIHSTVAGLDSPENIDCPCAACIISSF